MQDIEGIIISMYCCAKHGDGACHECPYKDRSGGGMTCRQRLLVDAMKALQDKALKCSELEAELETNRPSVCFEEETPQAPAGEGLAAAYYWRGQVDALKWWIQGYFGPKRAR